MQRAIPGLNDMYRLVAALVAETMPPEGRLLLVGAGGGREIEALGARESEYRITAVDPSARNLDAARASAVATGLADRTVFVHGTVDDVSDAPEFDAATSLLVMHGLPDDGAKLAYLDSIRARLKPGGRLVHADVCLEQHEFQRLLPAYRAYVAHAGVAAEAADIDPEVLPGLPTITSRRTGELFVNAGFGTPCEVFRSLWYRCWFSE